MSRLHRPAGLVAAVLVASASLLARQATRPDGLYAELQTSKGLIVLQLEFEKTPMTVANFVGLAEGTIENKAMPAGSPFFDGTVFHRVVAGHVIQAGIPKATERSPGYTIPNEIHPDLGHGRAGMLGMANSGPHTNSSQFYITLGDRSYLDGNYSVFGHVVDGMSVVNAIVQGDVVEKVRIVRVGKKADAFRVDTASFKTLVEQARVRVKEADDRKARDEEAFVKSRWPNAVASPKGAKFVVVKEGTGEQPQTGSTLKAIYTARLLDGRAIASSGDAGRPAPGDAAQAFAFEVGKTRITPGLDEALAAMRKGERRVVIVSGAVGYGNAGFYGKDTPGEKRFVISPNVLIAYEVEVLDIIGSAAGRSLPWPG